MKAIARLRQVIWASLEFVRAKILVRTGVWLERHLGDDALARSIAMARGASGKPRALADLEKLRGFFSSQAPQSLFDMPWVPIYVLVIAMIHWAMGLLAALAVVTFLGLAFLNDRLVRRPQTQSGEMSASARRLVDASGRNSEIVQALGMTDALTSQWSASRSDALDMAQCAATRSRAVLAVVKGWRFAIQIAIMGLGAYFVLHREIGPGAMVAGSILLGRALAPIENAIDTWRQVIGWRQATTRLRDFFASTAADTATTVSLPTPEGRIRVEHAVYCHPTSRRVVLRDIAFELPAGEVMAIVGPSGAGKSTLARLLVGIERPVSGTVRLDGADLAMWSRAALGPHIGYLPQDVELFAGTIARNIARMADKIDSEAVIAAAQAAGVHEMIMQLPQGYETEIGEDGQMLSGGQRQRIGLARAIYGQPRLIVLDEPNANLDQEGEAALIEAICELKKQGSTVVMIAHRLSMLAHVDRVLVLENGGIQAYGARDDVIARFARPRAVAPTDTHVKLAQA